MRILIAQADQALATFLCKSLEAESYLPEVVYQSRQILSSVSKSRHQMVIVDQDVVNQDEVAQDARVPEAGAQHGGLRNMLPGSSSSLELPTLIREIRAVSADISILVMSAQAAVERRVAALDAGADDFVMKPFSYFELAARIRVLLRRKSAPADATLQVGELKLDRFERTVSRAGKPIELTAREFRLLEFLMRNYGQKVSRGAILEHVWAGSGAERGQPQATPVAASARSQDALHASDLPVPGLHSVTNIVDVYINYLRQKLGDNREKRLIHTVRGYGYQLGGAIKGVVNEVASGVATGLAGELDKGLLSLPAQESLQPVPAC